MGVRGLAPAVRQYGKSGSLSGEAVVIDGPALIYQILNGCLRQRPPTNGFICHPSYAQLGHVLIGWLDELQRHDVIVRKIYFDGYLPPSKWQVRRDRLLYQSKAMRSLLSSHPDGSHRLPEDAFESLKPAIAITRAIGRCSHLDWLPKPPFLVPAVLETLKSSLTWGPIVEVVSGEADMFCAEDIRRNGGVLLTADSDLLITDLGPNGTMSFFSDVVAADSDDSSKGLVARKFSLRALNDILALDSVGGLPRVAFEMARSKISLNESRQRVMNEDNKILESTEFHNFVEEYSMKEYLPKDHPVQKILSNLDPRISEVVIQTLLLETAPDAEGVKTARGPETLAMFLPVMIEHRGRKSSWTMCTDVRQLAYSIMQSFAIRSSPTIIEYRLLEASNSAAGRQLDILGSEETLEKCRQLVYTFKELSKHIGDGSIRWLAFAIYQDVMWSASEQRLPLSVLLMRKVNDISGPNEHSWDVIHFIAQVQASLYSLRMVKQGLDVAELLHPILPSPMRELQDSLRTLPSILEWPTAENIYPTIMAAIEANILATVTGILGVPIIENQTHIVQANPSAKRKKGTGFLRSDRDSKRAVSINPFSVLSDASQG